MFIYSYIYTLASSLYFSMENKKQTQNIPPLINLLVIHVSEKKFFVFYLDFLKINNQ